MTEVEGAETKSRLTPTVFARRVRAIHLWFSQLNAIAERCGRWITRINRVMTG